MGAKTDILFIEPGSTRAKVYQKMGKSHAAIQPPFLSALAAGFIRNKGYNVGILDANAENLTHEETARKISEIDPKLINIVVYGQQAATCSPLMEGVGELCRQIKSLEPSRKIILTGWHPSAIPERTIKEEKCDFVCQGEGFHTLTGLLEGRNFESIPGLWWKEREDNSAIRHTARARNIENLSEELKDVAWDLLPMDKYRTPDWQGGYNDNARGNYAAIYTGFGCPFTCEFCSIHTLYGDRKVRHWNPEWVLNQIDTLVKQYGVKNLRVIDELFTLNPKHYLPILKGLIQRDYRLNIWAFTRIDTTKQEHLEMFKKAGFNWLSVGIESGSIERRKEIRKGAFSQNKIKKVVRSMEDAGIMLCSNYMFGHENDKLDDMQETFNLALDLLSCSSFFFSAMADPGSDLYYKAIEKGWKLPDRWMGYAQQSYECQPLSTKYVPAEDVLRFRDYAFNAYYTNPRLLNKIERTFGVEARKSIEEKTKIKLKRKLLGD